MISENKKYKDDRLIMKKFHCSVWGDITVSPLALSIIDTWEFQRMHYIRQTGFAYKVFSTATSSRFEHSIGVYHITRIILRSLELSLPVEHRLSDRQKEIITITGLVHDLGHGPFSHLFDEFLKTTSPMDHSKEQISRTHEQRSCDIFRHIVAEYNLEFSVEEVEWICQRITSPPNHMWYDTLVCNPYSSFDTDKLDYLIRDTKHFGLICSFDVHRIIQNMRIIDNKLCFCERVEDDVRNMFSLREQLHQSIYRHPTIQKFDCFFLSLLKTIRFECRSMEDFLQLQDVSLLMMFPFSIRKQLECRQWDSFHEKPYFTEYKDDQKDIALSNLLWFRRKTPHLYFTLQNE